jgi:carboxyl-terminal processing protease
MELDSDALLWKMPAFNLSDETLEGLLGKAMQRKALVIDMRGNTGGRIDTLERLIARTFPNDVVMGEIKERTGTRPWKVATRGQPFAGRLVVLVDSDSGSSAELFARALQLEKRGTVIGDRTSGSVMQARFRTYQMGADQVVYYYASISTGAVVMRDGGQLEGSGVVPDETVLPTAEDLAAGRDPALSRALKLAGLDVSPERSGKMFPFKWPK